MTTNTSPLLALAAQLDAGKPVISAWIGQDPHAATVLARQGFDAVCFDLQHSRLGLDDAITGIGLAAAAGKPSIVRIPVGEFQSASRVLDAGASGVIAPMINSAADARALVDFCKYPPLGQRSFGAYAALAMSGLDRTKYLPGANAFVRVFAMVETRAALESVEEILAVQGIDGVFVGPADLSIALSDGTAIDFNSAEVRQAMQRIAKASREAGKTAGVYALAGDWAAKAIEGGFGFVAVGSDTIFMGAGAAASLAAARAGKA